MPRALHAAGFAAAAGLLAGLLLGWRLWHGRPPAPTLLARLDTVLVAGPAIHDTLRLFTAAGQAAEARHDAALHRADSLAVEAARLGVRADSLAALAGDSAWALVVRTEERDRLREENQEVRAANRALADARSQFYRGMVLAEARIAVLEPALAKARAALAAAGAPPRWSAGAVWEPGSATPVGGYLARVAGPLQVSLQLTDGPRESPTVRGAVGLRF